MKGLLISSKSVDGWDGKNYSLLRLLESAASKGIDLQVVTPKQIELIVTRGDRKSILIDD